MAFLYWVKAMRHAALALFAVISIQFCGTALAATPANPTACEHADSSFKAFLLRFTDNKDFQRSRLVLPLVARSGNYETLDASVELWPLAEIERMKDPLIYSTVDRRKLNLDQDIVLFQRNRYAEVYQADAGEADAVRLLYRFRNLKGCWFLEEIDDRGL